MGVLDSSFLFMPLGNDLLILGLTASHPHRLLYYAVMASLGSIAGCYLVDLVSRSGGEEGLSRFLSERRLEYVRRKAGKNAGWSLAAGALMPPPFPFTPVIAAAAAFQYPRRKMYPILLGARMVRFLAIGLLAIYFGNRIVALEDSPIVHALLLSLAVLFVAGSAWSIYSWVKGSRVKENARQPG